MDELIKQGRVAVRCDTEEELETLLGIMRSMGMNVEGRVPHALFDKGQRFDVTDTQVSSDCVTVFFYRPRRGGYDLLHGTWDEYIQWCRLHHRNTYEVLPDVSVRMCDFMHQDDTPVEYDMASFDSFLSTLSQGG